MPRKRPEGASGEEIPLGTQFDPEVVEALLAVLSPERADN